jgi:cytidylate kinase
LSNNFIEEKLIVDKITNQDFNLVISIDPKIDQVRVNGNDITHVIREDEITSQVSFYAAMPGIRRLLVAKQRDLVETSPRGIIVEGRDIGSVVLPDANFKIYITANDDVRAKRRALQIDSDESDVLVAQRKRDLLDSSRKVSPLVVPKGAIVLDNSDLNFEESVVKFIEIVSQK